MLSMRKIAIFFFFKLVLSASAIVVANYNIATNSPSLYGQDLDWDYVYSYNQSSAVAVGRDWILTARHVADDNESGILRIGGTDYNPVEVVYHEVGLDPNEWADLALVRFDKDLPGYYPLYTDHFTTLPSLEVVMVGYGNIGTVSSNHWTMGTTGKGLKRWGSQIINSTSIHRYNPGGDVGVSNHRGFWMNFNLSNTVHEAGVAVGDSGGGVFYNGKLTGIMTTTRADPNATFALALPEYSDWIAMTVPEPAATGLMGLTILGLYFGRSLRRRRAVISSRVYGRNYICDAYEVFDADESGSITWAAFEARPKEEADDDLLEKWFTGTL